MAAENSPVLVQVNDTAAANVLTHLFSIYTFSYTNVLRCGSIDQKAHTMGLLQTIAH